MGLGFPGYLVETVVGAIVWLVANVVYLDMKQKGLRGFTRFLAFWLGTPTTWLTLMFAREGSRFHVRPPPDDEDALLEEVRRDRRLREGEAGPSLPETTTPEDP